LHIGTNKKRVLLVLASASLVLALVLARGAHLNLWMLQPREKPSQQVETPRNLFSEAFVEKVVDGDTIMLRNGELVRLIGIDAPERGEKCFLEAKNYLERFVAGRTVLLERDVENRDRYGRLLRYVLVDGVNVNVEMVRQGFAKAYHIGANRKYERIIVQAEKTALRKGLQCWLDGIPPKKGDGTLCLIKGNISKEGEKIYHLPSCPDYNNTKIEEEKGEKWFCTEEEAIKAGWRISKNCRREKE